MVHAVGGMASLVAVFVLGPRHGRFGIDGEVVELEGIVVRL
jgi:ammonia channel protein AmtB